MDRVDVVAAVEVVVDEDLPVAANLERATARPAQAIQIERGERLQQRSEVFRQRTRRRLGTDPDKGPPLLDSQRSKPIVLARKVGNAVELRRAAQAPGQVIRP